MEKCNGKERRLFERDVGPEDEEYFLETSRQVKWDLMAELGGCLESLDQSIDQYSTTGKVPIEGYYFDARFAKNLSNLMHSVLSGEEIDFQKAADFINLQLVTVSKCWRSVCAKLERLAWAHTKSYGGEIPHRIL